MRRVAVLEEITETSGLDRILRYLAHYCIEYVTIESMVGCSYTAVFIKVDPSPASTGFRLPAINNHSGKAEA
jgi:hypothetical protein